MAPCPRLAYKIIFEFFLMDQSVPVLGWWITRIIRPGVAGFTMAFCAYRLNEGELTLIFQIRELIKDENPYSYTTTAFILHAPVC